MNPEVAVEDGYRRVRSQSLMCVVRSWTESLLGLRAPRPAELVESSKPPGGLRLGCCGCCVCVLVGMVRVCSAAAVVCGAAHGF